MNILTLKEPSKYFFTAVVIASLIFILMPFALPTIIQKFFSDYAMYKEDLAILSYLLAILLPLLTLLYRVQELVEPSVGGIEHEIFKISGEKRLKYIGDASQAAKIVGKRLSRARNIYNVYITSGRPHDSATHQFIIERLISLVKSGKVMYYEVCGKYGAGRAEFIAGKLKEIPNEYNVRVLLESFNDFPVCNFIVIEYQDQFGMRDEVYFGWGHFEGHGRMSVFRSKDAKLIDYFKVYHAALSKKEISRPFEFTNEKSFSATNTGDV